MHISNVLKHDQRKKIATDFRMQLYYLLVVAVVSDVKVTSLSTWLLVVDNFSIRTEPHYINWTDPNSFRTESEFYQKPSRNKTYSTRPYLVIATIYVY